MRKNIEHGTRSKYVMGCRCDQCKEVALAYAKKKYYENRTILRVSADPVVDHILFLNKRGLGSHAIADASGVAHSTVRFIRQGRWKMLKKRTAERILSVTAEALLDNALVSAAKSRARIKELQTEGFTTRRLAHELGAKSWHPLKRKITARRELQIKKLYEKYMR